MQKWEDQSWKTLTVFAQSVRLDVNTDKQLSDYCEKNGISKGEAVREAVQQWLEHQK